MSEPQMRPLWNIEDDNEATQETLQDTLSSRTIPHQQETIDKLLKLSQAASSKHGKFILEFMAEMAGIDKPVFHRISQQGAYDPLRAAKIDGARTLIYSTKQQIQLALDKIKGSKLETSRGLKEK